MKNILICNSLLEFDKNYSSGVISLIQYFNENNYIIYFEKESQNNQNLLKVFDSEKIPYKFSYDETYTKLTSKDQKVMFEENFYDNCFDIIKSFRIGRRFCELERDTNETQIKIIVDLDGNGDTEIQTGVGFFDHMLEQIARHANIDLNIKVNGDLNVDEHHTVEDTGIALGEAINKAIGDKIGIARYGFFLPMDDVISKCAIDLGGRTYLNYKVKFKREYIGGFPTELFEEFFRGLASGLKANVFLRAKGVNEHHKAEALFKVFAKSLNAALQYDKRNSGKLPSTKGVI